MYTKARRELIPAVPLCPIRFAYWVEPPLIIPLLPFIIPP